MVARRRGGILFPGPRRLGVASSPSGFSLIELIITVSVLAILTLGIIPLVQVSVKRQKEYQLRAALREMREAIDQFHREAVAGAQMQVNQQQGSTTAQQEQATALCRPRTSLPIRECGWPSPTRRRQPTTHRTLRLETC